MAGSRTFTTAHGTATFISEGNRRTIIGRTPAGDEVVASIPGDPPGWLDTITQAYADALDAQWAGILGLDQ